MSHLFFAVAAAVLFVSAGPPGADAADAHAVKIDIVKREATGPAVEQSGGTGVVRVTQGEQVELHWTTDEATELHLHGYDVEAEVKPGGEAVMEVDARAAGRFAIESHGFGADHHAEKTLIYLEVLPR